MRVLTVWVFLVAMFSFVSEAGAGEEKDLLAKFEGREFSYLPGQIVVKLKPAPSKAQKTNTITSLIARYGAMRADQVFHWVKPDRKGAEDLLRIYVLHVSHAVDIEALVVRIEQEPQVEYAEPHFLLPLDIIPNDPRYSEQQHLPQVFAPEAWDVAKGDSNVVIADIDTGVDWDHSDLAAAIWTNSDEVPDNGIDDDNNGFIDDVRGWDFVEGIVGGPGQNDPHLDEDLDVPDNDPMDFNGHGTHVAGIAAAVTDNGVGVAALSWGARIMGLRVGWSLTNGGGLVSSLWASQAYVYAADNGASVANQSSGTSEVVLDGARYAYQNGVVICNSAGNSNTDFAVLLGSQPWALSVAALDSKDKKASYSSYNVAVDISAPGGDIVAGEPGILSTIVNPSGFYGGEEYVRFAGTSMASPLVASLAGLLKSQHPEWSPAQIMFQIAGTADNIDALNPDYAGKLGYGRINAFRAVTETISPPDPKFVLASVAVDDAAGGNGNGKLEIGESANIVVTLRNDWGDAAGVQAMLSVDPADAWSLTITNPTAIFGDFPGVSDLDNATKSNSSDAFTLTVSTETFPMVPRLTLTVSTAAGYSQEFPITLSIEGSVLFVDDVDIDIDAYYTSAFRELGAAYDHWNRLTAGTPSAALMSTYPVVVWACEWTFPSLDSADRAELAQFLDGGGRLFLSGQDIGWDLSDPEGTQNLLSGGASKAFYETYLRAQYDADDARVSTINGVPGDSIGDGFTNVAFRQPEREDAFQYPDVLIPINGSSPVFRFPDNSVGAVRYGGSYRLVYFGFGGYEAITDSSTRTEVMRRVLDYLRQANITLSDLGDTEDIASPRQVSAEISSLSAPTSVDLWWDFDGEFPLQKNAMIDQGGGVYAAEIPAPGAPADVMYYVLARVGNLSLLSQFVSYHAGPDQVPPTITIADTLRNSLNVFGPFNVGIFATDNIGIETTSASVHHSVNGGPENSGALQFTGVDGEFAGSFSFTSPLVSGDTVAYYFTVRDNSSQANLARYPETGEKRFAVGLELVDNFEAVNDLWDLGAGWGRVTDFKHSGLLSMHDSPVGNYLPNTTNTLTLNRRIDLSPFAEAALRFWRRNAIHTSDTVFVEASRDSVQWDILSKITGFVTTQFSEATLLMPGFAGGLENSNVRVRLRLLSDASTQAGGIWIDDVEFLTNDYIVSVERLASEELPSSFSVSQNYPNPFNPSTSIVYELPSATGVKLAVYNLLGEEVRELVNELQAPGRYRVDWDGAGRDGRLVSSGVYFYRLTTQDRVVTRKMILLR